MGRLFDKKGQGLSLNVIIIAAIVLIVLVVLWAIFTGRMGTFTKEVVKCRGGDQNCMSRTVCEKTGAIAPDGHEDCKKFSKTRLGGIKITVGEPVCCIPLG